MDLNSKSIFLMNSTQTSNRELAKMEPYTVLKGDTPRLIDEWQEVLSLWDATRAFVDENEKKLVTYYYE